MYNKIEFEEKLFSRKLYIFDMDGTIYLGDEPFDFAVRLIHHLRQSGKKVLFFTNNASRSRAMYYEKLSRLGFEPQPGEILSSADVTALFLRKERAGKTVYLVGTPALWDEFSAAGVSLVCRRDGTLVDPDQQADIVVTSFDTTLTYEKLRIACAMIRGGAEYLCTHPDFNCPTGNGPIPDSGALAAAVTAATGVKPTCFGKPYPETIRMIGAVSGVRREDMCVFGDRLYTDIAMGKRYGVLSVLVLSGETSREEALAAAPESRPDLIYEDLSVVDQRMFG